jgi:hypothetical protein
MKLDFEDIDELQPTKCQDIYKVHLENKSDYMKVKYILSRIPIRWTANDFTRTVYFCGKALGEVVRHVSKSKETSSDPGMRG